MRKGMHLGQPTPLSQGLVKLGDRNKYNANPAKSAITLGKNPIGNTRQGGPEIKQGGRNVPKAESY